MNKPDKLDEVETPHYVCSKHGWDFLANKSTCPKCKSSAEQDKLDSILSELERQVFEDAKHRFERRAVLGDPEETHAKAKAEIHKHFISKEKVAEAIGEDETSLEYDENTLPIVWQNANRIRAELRAKLLGERDG